MRSKPVIQMIGKKVVHHYESITWASQVTGINTRDITKCCKGQAKLTGLYSWVFESDFKKMVDNKMIEKDRVGDQWKLKY